MHLASIDWLIVGAFFIISLAIGIIVSRKSGKSAAEFFLSGRNMPWWLLGVSMVATTFSADTPNLVTDIIRQNGVAGNWVWWAFLLTGMLTVFVYSKLWRRSGVLTDLEFYELRYGGKKAAFLRGFRALYLGVFFNVVIMATVCVAAVKIGGVLLGLSPEQTLIIASVVTVVYSALGGLRGVLITDFFQFIMAMIGAIAAAYVILDHPEINGLSNLLNHENVAPHLNFIPDVSDTEMLIAVFIIPLAVQWWSVWYPGAEPGGGGYIAQRMLSAKDEKNAVGATLFFNIAHYALRPWPWILIALASMVVFPNLVDIQAAFPHVSESSIGHDLAYPAMLTFLPAGLLGLVVASLIAAFMSTISTHLNWGSSYVVNDFYLRFINQKASDKQQVNVGRISTVVLMIIAALLSYVIESAKDGFDILLQIGAGTGLIFILRWFWWRINAYTEITGMVVSFIVAIALKIIPHDLPGHYELILGVGITTVSWLIVTFITKPTDTITLTKFYILIHPFGKAWKHVVDFELLRSSKTKSNNSQSKTGTLDEDYATEINDAVMDIPNSFEEISQDKNLPLQILSMLIGCFTVYFTLFGVGSLIYSNYDVAALLLLGAVIGGFLLFRFWKKII